MNSFGAIGATVMTGDNIFDVWAVGNISGSFTAFNNIGWNSPGPTLDPVSL